MSPVMRRDAGGRGRVYIHCNVRMRVYISVYTNITMYMY